MAEGRQPPPPPPLPPRRPPSASLLRPTYQFLRPSQPPAAIDNSPLSTILNVPYFLRKVNPDAYTRQLISIGPYHHGSPHLKEMEEYKKLCFQWIKEPIRRPYEDFMQQNIEKVLQFYCSSVLFGESDHVDPRIHREQLKKITMVDGWFLVQLFGTSDHVDPFIDMQWIQTAIFHDLLLLENQLPLFVLENLYQIMTNNDQTDGDEGFASKAFSMLSKVLPGPRNQIRDCKITGTTNHLLSLVHDNWSPSVGGIDPSQTRVGSCMRHLCHALVTGMISICCAREIISENVGEWQSIRCASELEEAGIQFVKVGVNNDRISTDEGVKSLFHISFENGMLKIPTLVVDDYTERLFRNFIAYELYTQGPTYVTDYVKLIDNLVNSTKDVQLLRFSEVIENMLGDDEVVAQMINKLRIHVTPCGRTFYYEKIFVDVKKHCAKNWNLLMAKLRHDYCNNPWAFISFVAALLIILLTIGSFVTGLIQVI